MSWTTILWSAACGISLAMAGLHLLVWLKSRESWANLAFAVAALMAAITSQFELGMMHAPTPEAYEHLLRWSSVPIGLMIVSVAWFVRFYLGAGRLWLIWPLCAFRALIVLSNFTMQSPLHFRELTGLREIPFLGDIVVLPIGVPNPWVYWANATTVLLVVISIDAAIAAWRRGSQRQAAIVGGTISAATVLGIALSVMLASGVLWMPYNVSFVFLIIVLGMAYELSLDLVRARQTARELEQSQQRMRLAVRAANLSLWEWNIARDQVWVTEIARKRAGVGENEYLTLDRYLQLLHPDDRGLAREALRRAIESGEDFHSEFRVVDPDGQMVWISTRGQVERDVDGKPMHLRGVSMDITARKQAEEKIQEQRTELAHVHRVSAMGQLSSTLAHEINQPLAAILRNAEAGELFLQQDPPDLEELRAILADIQRDEKRAASVIERMRSLLKRRDLEFEPLDVGELVTQVKTLLHAEIQARQVVLQTEIAGDLPRVSGDRVHLHQVILNLLLNSIDALEKQPAERRQVVIRAVPTAEGLVELAVMDRGEGIRPGVLPHLFEPFVTTKSKGTGIGLAISRTIVEMHGGKISAESNSEGGATFRFTLKAAALGGAA